jgi:hypothetical protein
LEYLRAMTFLPVVVKKQSAKKPMVPAKHALACEPELRYHPERALSSASKLERCLIDDGEPQGEQVIK